MNRIGVFLLTTIGIVAAFLAIPGSGILDTSWAFVSIQMLLLALIVKEPS